MNVICDKCKTEFQVSAYTIKVETIIANKRKMQVTFFYCASCKQLYVILIRDETYTELEKDLIKTKERILKLQGTAKMKTLDKLSQMASVKYNKLKKYELKLKRQYCRKLKIIDDELIYRE